MHRAAQKHRGAARTDRSRCSRNTAALSCPQDQLRRARRSARSFCSICRASERRGASEKGRVPGAGAAVWAPGDTPPLGPCSGSSAGPRARCTQVFLVLRASHGWIVLCHVHKQDRGPDTVAGTFRLLSEELCRTRCLCLQVSLLLIFTQLYTPEQSCIGLHTRPCLLLFSPQKNQSLVIVLSSGARS